MAVDEDKGSDAAPVAAAPAHADGLDWSCRLKEVQRIEADPEDDDTDDLFAVTVALDGPNVEAEVEVIVPDAADVEVVAVALDTLQGALTAWADLLQRRKDDLRALLSEG